MCNGAGVRDGVGKGKGYNHGRTVKAMPLDFHIHIQIYSFRLYDLASFCFTKTTTTIIIIIIITNDDNNGITK